MNSSKAEETALHHAARGQTADLIDLLVEFGGNTQARDRHGCKPMDYTKPSTPAGTCLKAYGSKATSRAIQTYVPVILHPVCLWGCDTQSGDPNSASAEIRLAK